MKLSPTPKGPQETTNLNKAGLIKTVTTAILFTLAAGAGCGRTAPKKLDGGVAEGGSKALPMLSTADGGVEEEEK